jgi:glycosyltransferase involved in cell wall biosynthesis
MPERVLMTTDVVGGVWDFCIVLAEALRGRTNVTLLALGEPSAEQRAAASQAGADLRSAPLKLEWMQDSLADVERTRQVVASLVREVRPAVVHANQFAAACAEIDVPVVLTVHSDVLSWRRWTLGASDVPPEWRAYSRLVAEAVRSADAVVAVSQFLATEVRSLYEVSRPLDVIYNGWPSPVVAPMQRQRTTLVAGRAWDAAKNVALAAESAQGWNHGSVYLAGEQINPDHGGVATIARPLKSLGFLHRPEMDAWLRRAAIYLSPARYDPFGLLPLQAALQGCALLLSDIPSYRELWDGAACFFRSDDVADLRGQWSSLLEDSERRAHLRSLASARAFTRFTPTRMAEAYRSVYGNVRRRVAA